MAEFEHPWAAPATEMPQARHLKNIYLTPDEVRALLFHVAISRGGPHVGIGTARAKLETLRDQGGVQWLA